ncbi:HAMP domain-containing histidine kinase [bacterium]|nr:HAMP domain-containing histidine kinase [bacterium]
MSIFSFLFKKNKLSQLEQFPDAVIVFSKDFELLKYNSYAKRLLNLDGKSDEDLRPENLFDCDFNLLSNELLEENNICTLKLKDSDVFVEIKASNKNPEQIYFSLRDVTQKHKTITSFMTEYETSKKINRTKNNLLVKLSTELLSPLHSITGFSQAMLEGLSGKIDEKQKKYLNVINQNAFELLNFLDKLIEGAKLESNNYDFEFKVFDVIDAVDNTVKDFKEQFDNYKFEVDSSSLEKRTVYTDSNVLKKIIKYMTANLIKDNDYGAVSIKLENPLIEEVQKQGLSANETSQPKDFLHIEILSDKNCPKYPPELSIFEIYPQLELNEKKEVINNLPLYNAFLLSKYLKIKISSKYQGKKGFDIYLNIEKP